MIYIPNAYNQTQDPHVRSLQSALGNIGEGLAGFAHHKVNEMKERKERQQRSAFWRSIGLNDETAEAFSSAPIELQKQLLDRIEGVNLNNQQQQAQQVQPRQAEQIQQMNPQAQAQQQFPEEMQQQAQPEDQQAAANKQAAIASLQQQAPQVAPQAEPQGIRFAASPAQQKQQAALEQKKVEFEEKKSEKLKPVVESILDSEAILKEMKNLLKNGNVQIGTLTDLARNAPLGVGNKFLNSDTGLFDTLSNELAIREQASLSGSKNVTQLKAIQASKPGLDRTKEQNLKTIDSKLSKIKAKKSRLAKEYPFLKKSLSAYPDPDEYENGTVINNGEIRLKKVNGEWEEYNGK